MGEKESTLRGEQTAQLPTRQSKITSIMFEEIKHA